MFIFLRWFFTLKLTWSVYGDVKVDVGDDTQLFLKLFLDDILPAPYMF